MHYQNHVALIKNVTHSLGLYISLVDSINCPCLGFFLEVGLMWASKFSQGPQPILSHQRHKGLSNGKDFKTQTKNCIVNNQKPIQ
jgi:hypothetical protein